MKFDQSHIRLNPLTGEHVLVSPDRLDRPWGGKKESLPSDNIATYDPDCYLCPGNTRANGRKNPDYLETYVFTNDFSALQSDSQPFNQSENDLLVSQNVRGVCRVLCYSPTHNLTIPLMEIVHIQKIIDTWIDEYEHLSSLDFIRYIQIFENKGSIMGCSNQHPHGQIWATDYIPDESAKEDHCQKAYFKSHGNRTLIGDYLILEKTKYDRIVIENKHWIASVPFWAKWPFETLVAPIRVVSSITELTGAEKISLADILRRLAVRYDNLFQCSFPYTMGIHQAPVHQEDSRHWHFHFHFYPPLLRSATIQKFMVGFEMLAHPQRDISPEAAAEKLRELSEIHYLVKDK